jgi:asparagine synthase (glutamine-hydrolysing)
MCGICGVYDAWSGELASRNLVERMTRAISHGGPDDSGRYTDGPVGLGFVRLSIIDLDGGHQPMCNETGDIWIVFNGEIRSLKPLRQPVFDKWHRFATDGDTETIIRACEEFGIACPKQLHGMFGFPVWDAPCRRLSLARARAGKKPLYCARTQGRLVFASAIEALLYRPQLRREADSQALADFLSMRPVPGPVTLFAGIFKVLPGHWLLCEDGCIRDFTFGPTEERSEDEYITGIRQQVWRAVEERMMADVAIGALLSGWVDSSVVTGTMSQLVPHRIKPFAVGVDVPGYSELPYARLVAEHFGTERHELVVNASDLPRSSPLLTWYRDEPVSEPSHLGAYLIPQLARQQVKVVLTGEGGDELFSRYPKYAVDWMARYLQVIPAHVRQETVARLLDRLPYSMRKLNFAARSLGQPTPRRWMAWFGGFNGQMKGQLPAPALRGQIDGDASRAFRCWLDGNPQRNDRSSMVYLDTTTWLPDNLHMKAAERVRREHPIERQDQAFPAQVPLQAGLRRPLARSDSDAKGDGFQRANRHLVSRRAARPDRRAAPF